MEEWEQLREDIKARKLKQNARRIKAGKPLMHPELVQKPARPSKARKPPPPESGDEDDTMLSFDEWKECGWSVKKGEKCAGFDPLGIPQFTRNQVRRLNPAWEQYRKRK